MSTAALRVDDVLRATGIAVGWNGKPVLSAIDLAVPPGRRIALLGSNGSGKTTLLRALAGLVPVTAGAAVVLGHDLQRDARAVRRQVGLLGHGAALYDDLTVAENVRFWARAGGAGGDVDVAMTRAGIDARVRDVIGARLSAGQRRRAALAILLARDARLWLLDEPHAGLDAAGRDALDAEIRGAVSRGTTVVVASHELDRASALATRTVTVAGGHLVEPVRVP